MTDEENPHDTAQRKMLGKALQIHAAEMMLADRERYWV
jgi:hypothetical protein